jgi:transposase-like protein
LINIYTTNAVESVNSSFRKVTKNGAPPNENALLNALPQDAELQHKCEGRLVQNWPMVLNQLLANEKFAKEKS